VAAIGQAAGAVVDPQDGEVREWEIEE